MLELPFFGSHGEALSRREKWCQQLLEGQHEVSVVLHCQNTSANSGPECTEHTNHPWLLVLLVPVQIQPLILFLLEGKHRPAVAPGVGTGCHWLCLAGEKDLCVRWWWAVNSFLYSRDKKFFPCWGTNKSFALPHINTCLGITQ